jgi:hypothetical protein
MTDPCITTPPYSYASEPSVIFSETEMTKNGDIISPCLLPVIVLTHSLKLSSDFTPISDISYKLLVALISFSNTPILASEIYSPLCHNEPNTLKSISYFFFSLDIFYVHDGPTTLNWAIQTILYA